MSILVENTACCVRNGSWQLAVEKLFLGPGEDKWFSILGIPFYVQEIGFTSPLDLGEIFLHQYLYCLSKKNDSPHGKYRLLCEK